MPKVVEELPEGDNESMPLEVERDDAVCMDVEFDGVWVVVSVDTGLVEAVWLEGGTVDELCSSSRYTKVAMKPSAIDTTKLLFETSFPPPGAQYIHGDGGGSTCCGSVGVTVPVVDPLTNIQEKELLYPTTAPSAPG